MPTSRYNLTMTNKRVKDMRRYGSRSGLTKRAEQVQVRLVTSSLGAPVQVKFTPAEYEAVHAAAREHTQSGAMSTFIRGLGVASAAHLHEAAAHHPADVQVQWLLETAAEECAMIVGEYLRVVCLEAVGFTQVCKAASAARAALAAGLLREEG